jgi:glycosyltransferase involved in cell wall biosynthesis
VNVLHIGYSASFGGAARAMQRIHVAIQSHGVYSEILANIPDPKLDASSFNLIHYYQIRAKFRNSINKALNLLHTSPSKILNSHALLTSKYVKEINNSDADIVHLHWINGETLSIKDITRIEKPIVWTLHDMWLICGSEHVTQEARWKSGYQDPIKKTKIGFDLERWTWNRKVKYWQQPIELVTPSHWMNKLVSESPLTSTWSRTTIKNPIDTTFWSDVNGYKCTSLNKKKTTKFLFGSMNNDAHHKGGDLFHKIFNQFKLLGSLKDKIEFLVIGGKKRQIRNINGFKCTELGLIGSDHQLKQIYLEVDSLIIPSRIDNLPNMGVEALSCGVPIIGFDVCGLPDIIEHLKTGYLAKPFSVSDLAKGILYVTNCNEEEYNKLRENSRQKAVNEFSQKCIGVKYLDTYRRVLERD